MDIQDLVKKFGSGSSKDDVSSNSDYSDLIKRFGSNGGEPAKVLPASPQQPQSNIPQPGEPVSTPEQIATDNPAVADIKKAPSYIYNKSIEGFQSGKQLAGEGFKDIFENKPATGVGKAAFGLLSEGANLTGIPAATEGLTKFVGKAIGNPEAAQRAEAVVTSGLPIGKATKAATEAFIPSNRAINKLVEAIGPDNLPKVVSELKSNPRLTLMDVDPNVQVISQGLAAKPGMPRNYLDSIVKLRGDTAKDTVVGAYDEAMGAPVSIKKKVDDLKQSIKNAGKEINPVLDQTKPVDVSSVVAEIDAKLKPGVNSVISAGEPLPGPRVKEELKDFRQYLTNDKSLRTDPKELHSIQAGLRARAENLLNSQNGQDREVGYALMNVRNKIVGAIDKSSPQIQDAQGNLSGSYKAKLSKYRDVNDIQDAFNKGMLVTRNKLGRLEDHPEYWGEWVKGATPQELEAAKQGARLAIAHQMSAFRFAARKGMEVPESEFNADKLKLLFGDKEVTGMMKTLSDERKIADTNTKLFQNSQTAMRLLGAKTIEERPAYKPNYSNLIPLAAEGLNQYLSGGTLPVVLATGYGYTGARNAMTKVGQKIDRGTNFEISKLASASGQDKEALIKLLEQRMSQPKLSAGQKLRLALPTSNP